MCGIAGYYSSDNTFNYNELNAVGESIQHRGPEHQGIFHDDTVGLVHRRLKIIDLSDLSNQPMTTDDGRYVMVYNGEIYNYDELRREWINSVKTQSDTEVLLRLLTTHGIEAIEDCNGMFAIALYDSIEKKLILIRDRMGVKPLYYFWDGKHFAFASEIKALLQFKFISSSKTIDYESLNRFLHLGYCGQCETIYSQIRKVPAGSYLIVTSSGLETHQYWSTYNCIEKETITDLYSAKEILRDLIEQSIRYRLRSDVPFGTFLSGGIDSSLITAVAQHNLSTKLNTFTISFAENKYDESKYARNIANYLGTNHTELQVTQRDATQLIPELLSIFDEPYADSSAIPTLLVSKLAKTKATMILSGDGGDELFMGYGAYSWAKRLNNKLLQTTRRTLYWASRFGNSRIKRIGTIFNYPSKEEIPSHIFSQEQYLFSRKEIHKILNKNFYQNFELNEYQEVARNMSNAENQALFDINYYLREDLLPKIDRASMHHSLEVRVPLLDYTIVEFALNLDESLKIHNGTQKYLLRQVLYDYVPSHLFERPKWGFSIPLCEWLHADLHYLIDDYLNKKSIETIGVFNYSKVQSLCRRFDSGRNNYLYNRIWQVIVIQNFLMRQ